MSDPGLRRGARILRLATVVVVIVVLLAPGWFPVTALLVDGTQLLRSDHGCSCGRFATCTCHATGHLAGHLDGHLDGDGSKASHTSHTMPHHDHGETAEPSCHGTVKTPEPVACSKPARSDELPDKPAVMTVDFRCWVGSLPTATPDRAQEVCARLLASADRLPPAWVDPPDTPPPKPFESSH